eukprot:TRINITY_DN600_c0_g1_i2.p1 TRINITY_DN600_c0_g1~~TRINITY_DN600_c0_g1_i2.p1  ORF type:complete len:484 (+),score=75.40 TRINITY_DN600_c0_g1_i2:282-1733(+)
MPQSLAMRALWRTAENHLVKRRWQNRAIQACLHTRPGCGSELPGIPLSLACREPGRRYLFQEGTLCRSTADVVAVVNACRRHHVPITAFSGGTSLEGHTLTPYAGITLDMSRMKAVRAVHEKDMDVVLEPGVGWIELNEKLKDHGLFFPLDPGPGATIGGMCATRCSGSLAVRYGTMRDNVIALEVVLANGKVVKTSSRARKSAAGYDLTRLMVGSEGTLGVITEITLRLQKIPEASAVAMCHFPTLKDAADVAIACMHSGIQVSRVELLDSVQIHAINLANSFNYPEEPTLMFELIGTEAYVGEQVERVRGIVRAHGGGPLVHARSEEEKKELWRVRKEALWAAYTLKPGTEALITDVCVPLSRLADCISATQEEVSGSSLPCPILAHAGDGNVHVCIFVDASKPEEVAEAKKIANNMIRRALAMGGTCTGEHGVGTGKMHWLEEELGPNAVAMMASIKKAVDPEGIMNPGKVIPSKFFMCS